MSAKLCRRPLMDTYSPCSSCSEALGGFGVQDVEELPEDLPDAHEAASAGDLKEEEEATATAMKEEHTQPVAAVYRQRMFAAAALSRGQPPPPPSPNEACTILTVWSMDGAEMQGALLENVVHRIRERCMIISYYVADNAWLWCKAMPTT